MTKSIQRLSDITNVLLSPKLDYTAVRNACLALSEYFYAITEFKENEPEEQAHIPTSSGLAVGPYSAAFCIIDFLRTRNFMLGVKQAIDDRLKLKKGEPVIVMYAGTGPFATLVTPLITQYSPDELQLVLLEINPVSIAYLQKLIFELTAANYIKDIVQEDASQYKIPASNQPDVLLSETMKPALEKEPQVSVVSNLLVQCTNKPVLIPECITVSAGFIGNLSKNAAAILPVGNLLKFDKEAALQIGTYGNEAAVLKERVFITMPETIPDGYNKLALLTEIHIYKEIYLKFNESGLTISVLKKNIADIKKHPARLSFQYGIANNPGFRMLED